jgi:superkiller protein 3
MQTHRVKIKDLLEIENQEPSQIEAATILAFVSSRFGFLPNPIGYTIDGDEVVITFPDIPSAEANEAERLQRRAALRLAQGQYRQAIGILKRVLELDPSLHEARRDLAMAYCENDQIEQASDHLVELLRLNPSDVSSLIVMANLYVAKKSDIETGELFFLKALKIEPTNVHALSGLAETRRHQKRLDEAISLFERAIQIEPRYPNSYCGQAFAYLEKQLPKNALDSLERLSAQAQPQDVRSIRIFDLARHLHRELNQYLSRI